MKTEPVSWKVSGSEPLSLIDSSDVVLYFLDSVGVARIAGVAYGLSPCFRLSIATSIETLAAGMERERMAGAVSKLR